MRELPGSGIKIVALRSINVSHSVCVEARVENEASECIINRLPCAAVDDERVEFIAPTQAHREWQT